MYKLSISGGMYCPNRDGTCGTEGCIFCSEKGSGDFAQDPSNTITNQLVAAKERIKSKCKTENYIAYFQSFTNTYGEIQKLKKLYYEAIAFPGVKILSIATRPDCLSSEIISLLAEINQSLPVWVELGLQTTNPQTAEYIRRGYPNRIYKEAVAKLKAAGITVITHIIIGLPGETLTDCENTVKYAVNCKTDGIKLQLLHVLSDTDLYKDYLMDKFSVLSLQEYTDILIKCIELVPPYIVIHRITGDGPKKLLVAPLWSGDKKAVLNYIKKQFEQRNSYQGKRFNQQIKLRGKFYEKTQQKRSS